MINQWAKESIDLYVSERRDPGDFLTAVLSNDLREACARADDSERLNIHQTVQYCYNHIPAGCWGSRERVKSWLSGS